MRKIHSAFAVLAISAVSFSAFATPGQYGEPAAASSATKTIVIKPDTQWVNVEDGDTVKFVADGREFAWTFDGPADLPFALSEIAPAGAVPAQVKVFVSLNQEEREASSIVSGD